jgi:hypothetical protein
MSRRNYRPPHRPIFRVCRHYRRRTTVQDITTVISTNQG